MLKCSDLFLGSSRYIHQVAPPCSDMSLGSLSRHVHQVAAPCSDMSLGLSRHIHQVAAPCSDMSRDHRLVMFTRWQHHAVTCFWDDRVITFTRWQHHAVTCLWDHRLVTFTRWQHHATFSVQYICSQYVYIWLTSRK